MNIISHNINGINAFLNNGKLSRLLEMNADVYCLQEVKTNDINKIIDVLNKCGLIYEVDYKLYASFSEFKKGYAGVATIVMKSIFNKIINEYYPEKSSLILENISGYGSGRIVTTEFNDFYLINVYVINSGGKIEDRYVWDRNLINYLNSLNKPFILCGDMNVCSTYKDYWGNYERSIDTSPGLMQFEIDGFKKIIDETDSVDIYRMIHPEGRDYSYVCMGTRNLSHGWRLDYFICSRNLFGEVNDVKIYNNWQKWDHMPIELNINYESN